MPYGDDLDERFNELVAQIDAEERRRMRATAKKEARTGRRSRSGRRPGRADGPSQDSHLAGPPRRIGQVWLAMATVAALIAAAGVVITLRPDLLAPSGAIPEETMPVQAAPLAEEPEPEETVAAETTAGQEETAGPSEGSTAAGPFEGSAAEDWAEGAAGFAMPKAKALGGLSKKQVAEGLKRARDLLAAAHLDRETLMGGNPTPFVKLLHPDQRSWFRKNLNGAKERNTRSWVTSFAPKTAEQATDVIKVHGRTKLSAFKEDGITGAKLEINHLIVYAIQRPGRPDTTMRLVKHHRGTVLMYRDTRGTITWITDWGSSATPARCDVRDGYIHPAYPDSAPDKEVPVGTPTDPYVLDEERHTGECRAAKRT
ncbi:hypothetical protein OHA25_46980 [Nonomuraea sp. NBC_00507]|uniref:hypothetical protein n=1 Tax=Nonomuraea sp. NBC_00507 TaxID=2976002 RepID=UPI002E19CCB5